MISSLLLLQASAFILLMCCSAFFSSSETALYSLSPLQLKRISEKFPTSGAILERLLSDHTQLLSTILIGNTLVNVSLSVLGFEIARKLIPAYAELASVLVLTLLLLILGEVAPKRIAITWPEKLSHTYARPLNLLVYVFTPLRLMLMAITNSFTHIFASHGRVLNEDEFKTVLDVSKEEGVLDENERLMLRSIIRMEDLQASDVMTPRVDIKGIDLKDTPAKLTDFVREAGVRYMLLYEDSLDQVKGLLNVKDFLLSKEVRLSEATEPAYFVPETTHLDQLLEQLQEEQCRTAVVVDEYGGTAGIITRGDITEEVIGEIDDEFNTHKLLIDKLGPGRWLADGQLSLEDLNLKFNIDLHAEGSDRLAGWLVHQLGHIPRIGESVKSEQCKATVYGMQKNRITLIMIELQAEEVSDD